MMIPLVEFLYKKISTTPPYDATYELLKAWFHGDDKKYFNQVYNENYNGKDVKEVFLYIRRTRWRQKKRTWYRRSVEGFQHFQKTGEVKRGNYRHLVDDYLFFKEVWDKDPSYFTKTFKFSNIEEAIQDRLNTLEQWYNSDDTYLVEYLYLSNLPSTSQIAALKDDLAVLQGKWLQEHEDLINQAILKDGELWLDKKLLSEKEDEDIFISQAPYTAMKYPMIGVSNRRQYELDQEQSLEFEQKTLVRLKPHAKYEMGSQYEMYFSMDKDLQSSKVRSLDSKDWVIFIEVCNRRDINFQRNRWIKVYLSDLVESVYDSVGGWAYQDLIDRLLRMRDFTIVYRSGEEVGVRSFFTDVVFKKDLDGREYATIHVGPLIFNNIIREEMINVYGKEIESLKRTNPLAHHLSFVVQKIRLLSYSGENIDKKSNEKPDIQFNLTWDELNETIRMNKRTKKENLDDIETALETIKKKNFLIKDFKRYRQGFKVVCYPLEDYELQDMRRVKLSFNRDENELLQIDGV